MIFLRKKKKDNSTVMKILYSEYILKSDLYNNIMLTNSLYKNIIHINNNNNNNNNNIKQ